MAHALPLDLAEVRAAPVAMQNPQHTFPVDVHTGWIDFSPALHWYATERLRSALAPVGSRVRSATVRIHEHEPHEREVRHCVVDVALQPSGTVSASCSGANLRALIDEATEAVRAQLHGPHEDEAATELCLIA